mgnify:FL=1
MFQVTSNSPVKHIPNDYMPEGTGAWFTLSKGADVGKKMFYYDFILGQNSPTNDKPMRTIFFVHGNPECSFTYAKIRRQIMQHWPACDQAIRIIAMDHIGFGLSDQASFEMVDKHHATNLQQLIRHLDVTDVTLVIHDWGGAIGIGSFLQNSQRVRALVLMNTTIFPVPTTGLTYKSFPFRWLAWNHLGFVIPAKFWRYTPPSVLFSPAGKWNVLKHFAGFYVRALIGKLTQDEIFYRDMFSTKMNALSSKRNVKQTRVWGHGYEYIDKHLGPQSNREFYKDMQTMLIQKWGKDSEQSIPVRAFFGEFDPLARIEVKQQWLHAMPNLQGNIRSYKNVGHFVEEHEYKDIAQGILEVTVLNTDNTLAS